MHIGIALASHIAKCSTQESIKSTVVAHVKQALKLINMENTFFRASSHDSKDYLKNPEGGKVDLNEVDF